MKKFTFILAIVLIAVPFVSFGSTLDTVVQWANETTYIYGHDVTGTISNGLALLCMVGPAIVALSYTAIVFVKAKLQRA